MQIGISTIVETKSKSWKRITDFVDFDFKRIELRGEVTMVRGSNVPSLQKLIKEHQLGISIHSFAYDFFYHDPIIADSERARLKTEIRLASLLGGSKVILHFQYHGKLNSEDKDNFQELLDFAKENKVKLCLENNTKNLYGGDYLVEVLNEFEDLYFCLDIGHLNIALNNGSIKNLESFLNSIKHKVLELHVHYNSGEKDEHKELNKKGKKYLLKILEILDNDRLDLIIETINIKQALKTKRFLEGLALNEKA